MTEQTPSIKPLRNVAAMATLMQRLETRLPGLEGMAVFYGPSGYGKTFAATHCALVDPYAIHVVVQDVWTKRSFCEAILVELGIKPKHTVTNLVNQVQEGLINSGRPLIVDEADRAAKRGMIEMIRDIHDNSGCPIILVGEETLPQALMKWERVHGRMLDWVAAEPADLQDAKLLAQHYAKGVEVGEDLLKKMVVETRGSIRRITVNCAQIREFGMRQGLDAVGVAEFTKPLFVGEPPKMRGLS
ncbi:AAA family ATPase [Tropicimonas sp. S265A]|uniref:AAA family ATPase n=1 Tax=Tropicimonas sp. S265A TaxID=3415134 RepID=UPI003C79E3B5